LQQDEIRSAEDSSNWRRLVPYRYNSHGRMVEACLKEIQAILNALEASRRAGEPCVLATIVKTEGSTYRKAGARMLITIDRRTCGTISGGCLEQQVARDAFALTQTNGLARLALATTQDDDHWRSGAGCHGVVHLLLEQIAPHAGHGALEFIANSWKTRQAGTLPVVFETNIPGLPCGQAIALHGEAELSRLLRHDVASLVPLSRPFWKRYETHAGYAEVLMSPIAPPPRVLLCGSGHDAIPVARLAHEMGWPVTLFDSRAKQATAERFPSATIVTAEPADVAQHADAHTAAVLMTHRFVDDLELLGQLLPVRLPYVGILGPRGRTERLLAEITAAAPIPPEQLASIRSPIGLDLGSETPEQIALAIIAEIQAVLAERNGLSLTQKVGPLQIPSNTSVASCRR
jgi:xanthine dehydrogenase accessory factor